jgi:hypothetical protein
MFLYMYISLIAALQHNTAVRRTVPIEKAVSPIEWLCLSDRLMWTETDQIRKHCVLFGMVGHWQCPETSDNTEFDKLLYDS